MTQSATRVGTQDPRLIPDASVYVADWPVSDIQDTRTGDVESQAFSATTIEPTPVKWTMQIWDLGNSDYHLNEPILALIEEYPSDETVMARFPEVEAFGEGETEAEAVINLKRDILDLFLDLKSGDQKMGPLPQGWLRVLERLISEV